MILKFWIEWIDNFIPNQAVWTTKWSWVGFKATSVVVSRALLGIKDFKVSYSSINYISILLRVGKSFFKIIYILISTNRKICWRN